MRQEDFRLFKLARMTELQRTEPFKKRVAPLPDPSAERCRAAVRRLLVAGGGECRRLLPEERFYVDFFDSASGVCDKGSVCLGSKGSGSQEKNG